MKCSDDDSSSLIVTAAGEGRRFEPITSLIPKCFLPVAIQDGGVECALSRLIRQFGSAQIDRVYVAASRHPWFEELSRQRPDLAIVAAEPLGEWSAVSTCIQRHEINGPVIVVSGDNVLSDQDVEDFVAHARRPSTAACLVGGGFEESMSRYTRLEVSGTQVRTLVEKPEDGRPGLAKAGIYYLDASSLTVAIDSPARKDRFGEFSMTEMLLGLIETKVEVGYHTLNEGFCDIGSADGLKQATLRTVEWLVSSRAI
jgi:dTDP-glucose pyrophosphorylase